MNNSKKRSNKDARRRSALSFISGNGSLDVDHVLQSKPWENAKKFQNSEAACIQNILNEFVDKISQEKKTVKAKDHIPAKKSSKSTKKSPIKVSTMDLPGTSSSTNGSVAEIKTTLLNQKTISQELPCNTDDVKEEIQKFSKNSAKKNVGSNKKIIKRESLQDLINFIEKNLQTSTPKKEIRKTTKTAKGEESTTKNKKPETKNSGNKSEKNVQPKRRLEEEDSGNKSEKNVQPKRRLEEEGSGKKSENNTKNKQANTNLLGEKKKTEVKSENKLKCNKVNQNSSKNKVKACAILNEVKKECKVAAAATAAAEINDNIDKSAISHKEYVKKMFNQLKWIINSEKETLNQLKWIINSEKKNPEDKLQKSGQTPKSKMKNIKCQCEKSCIKCSDSHSLGKEHYERNRQREKNLKATRAIEDLSQLITDVKEKINSIKIDLEENNESLDYSNNFNDPCSQPSNSTSLSLSSHPTSLFYSYHTDYTCGIVDCSCSHSFSSDFSSFSGSSESTTERNNKSESTSEGADPN